MCDEGDVHCLWHAKDGRCASCKARRYRLDALGMREDYNYCTPDRDYPSCEFFKKKPVIERKC